MNNIIHFVGIGGIGMSSLACHFLHLGYTVSGSDLKETPLTQKLQMLGATVFYGHSESNVSVDCGLVVHTSAVSNDNCELKRANDFGIPIVLREQILGKVFNSFEKKIAVCGVHGKTTTTSMLDFVLRKLEISHSAFIGGLVCDTNSNYTCGEKIVVAEACEFNKSFLNLFPDIIVVLNVEHDHPDCFKTLKDIENAFEQFFLNTTRNGIVVACGDCVNKKLLYNITNVTFGLNDGNIYTAKNLECHAARYSFDFFCRDEFILHIDLNSEGKHNVYNALATLVTCHILGADLEKAAKHLSEFAGAQRRFMRIPCHFTNAVEDYAHHPTEISALIDTALCFGYKKIFAVFQPHTYSRTAALWERFKTCFLGVDELLILPIYSAREKPVPEITSQNLCRDINFESSIPCKFFERAFDAYFYLKQNAKPDDLVLIVGAGDIYELSEMMSEPSASSR